MIDREVGTVLKKIRSRIDAKTIWEISETSHFPTNRPIYLSIDSHWPPTYRFMLKTHGEENLQMVVVILFWIASFFRYLCSESKDANQTQKEKPLQVSRDHDRRPCNDHTGKGHTVFKPESYVTSRLPTLSSRWGRKYSKKMSWSVGHVPFFQ